MLHKPRHSKFCRKLLPFTARSRFVKSCKSLWLLEEKKKQESLSTHCCRVVCPKISKMRQQSKAAKMPTDATVLLCHSVISFRVVQCAFALGPNFFFVGSSMVRSCGCHVEDNRSGFGSSIAVCEGKCRVTATSVQGVFRTGAVHFKPGINAPFVVYAEAR